MSSVMSFLIFTLTRKPTLGVGLNSVGDEGFEPPTPSV
jgi:hypothetical protein